MPKYVDAAGSPVDATAPERLLWFAYCAYWTDDWSKLGSNSGIPVCPHCSTPGFQMEAGNWDKQVRLYTASGHPHYDEFMDQQKEKCLGRNVKLADAYHKWLDEHPDKRGR